MIFPVIKLLIGTASIVLPVAAGLVLYLLSGRERRELDGERRRLRGFCCQCGYDMRATPHRCPECGTPFKPE